MVHKKVLNVHTCHVKWQYSPVRVSYGTIRYVRVVGLSMQSQ